MTTMAIIGAVAVAAWAWLRSLWAEEKKADDDEKIGAFVGKQKAIEHERAKAAKKLEVLKAESDLLDAKIEAQDHAMGEALEKAKKKLETLEELLEYDAKRRGGRGRRGDGSGD